MATWSGTATAYAHFAHFTGGFATDAVDALLARPEAAAALPRDRPVRVLDIASGTGVAAFAAAEALCRDDPQRAVEVRATDLAEGMLEGLRASPRLAAIRQKYPNVSVATEVADMQTLESVADGWADVALVVFGIMFPPEPAKALAALRRVLAPGTGVAAVVTWHYNSMFDAFGAAAVADGKIANVDEMKLPLLKFGDEGFLRRLFRSAGFKERDGGLGVPPNAALADAPCVTYDFHRRPAYPLPVEAMVMSANTNPALQAYAPFDEAKTREVMLGFQTGTNAEGMATMPALGTVLVATVTP